MSGRDYDAELRNAILKWAETLEVGKVYDQRSDVRRAIIKSHPESKVRSVFNGLYDTDDVFAVLASMAEEIRALGFVLVAVNADGERVDPAKRSRGISIRVAMALRVVEPQQDQFVLLEVGLTSDEESGIFIVENTGDSVEQWYAGKDRLATSSGCVLQPRPGEWFVDRKFGSKGKEIYFMPSDPSLLSWEREPELWAMIHDAWENAEPVKHVDGYFVRIKVIRAFTHRGYKKSETA